MVLFSPEIGASFLALQKAEEANAALSPRARPVVILTVGAVWGAPYELHAHAAVARKSGFDDATILALAKGKSTDVLSAEERIAQSFTHRLVADRRVDAELYRTAQAFSATRGLSI